MKQYNQMDRLKRSRLRRRRRNVRRVLCGSLALAAVISITAAGIAVKRRSGRMTEPYTAEADEKRNETEILGAGTAEGGKSDGVGKTAVNGVEITGLDRQQAEKMLLAKPWSMTVVYGGEPFPVENVAEQELRRVLDTVYGAGQMKIGEYQMDAAALRESAMGVAKAYAAQWNRKPVSSQMEAFDKATGLYTYSEAVEGRTLNEEALAEGITEAAVRGDYSAQLEPEFAVTAPERTAAQAREQYQVVGSYTTKTTSNRNRNQNILLAVEAIDGKILKPGEEFSFNLATGNRTKDKGYQPAGAYRNGVLIEEPGGGVCQVSTTLYNALVSSGLQATERHSHSFAPSYIQSGQDAMVSFDGYAGPDLKFVNTEKTAVAIRASMKENVLKISIVGLPILEDGVKVTMRSEKVRDVEPPAPVYEKNESLAAGAETVVDSGQKGSVWKTFRVVTKGDQVLEETPLHNTTYRGKSAVIQKNDGEGGSVGGSQGVPDEIEGAAGNETQNSGSAAADGSNAQGEAEQGQAEQSQAEQPQGGQSQTGQSQADQSQTGQSHTSQSQAGQSQAGQSQAGQSQMGQPQAGQPQSGQSQTGQPQAGQSQAEQSQTVQPQSDQSQADQPQPIRPEGSITEPSRVISAFPG